MFVPLKLPEFAAGDRKMALKDFDQNRASQQFSDVALFAYSFTLNFFLTKKQMLNMPLYYLFTKHSIFRSKV